MTVLVSSRTVPPLAISAIGFYLGLPLLREDREDRGGECGLAVVDVTDGADVHVRLYLTNASFAIIVLLIYIFIRRSGYPCDCPLASMIFSEIFFGLPDKTKAPLYTMPFPVSSFLIGCVTEHLAERRDTFYDFRFERSMIASILTRRELRSPMTSPI